MRIFWMFLAILPLFGATTEIVFWHAFEGFLANQFTEIVNDFNHQSKNVQVKLVYKGNYTEVFNLGSQAFVEKNPPHILQVYEVATQTMMQQREMYIAVDDLMRRYYKKFDPAIYIDAVREFYSDSKGQMYSLPWNASTGILFYNKDAFAEAGLDPKRPPKTWEEMEEFGKKLVESGYVGFTTAWPAAYHLEHLCSWHNLPFATHENGFGGLDARLDFNGEHQIRHLSKLIEWQKEGIFSYQGRFTNEPEAFFKSGLCAILLQGANRYPMLKGSVPIGVGFMPYWADINEAPYRLNIGGSSFWVMSGFDDDVYRGIAQFLSYLSSAEVQSDWHEKTGYLPITEAAYYLSKKRGFYENNHAAEIAVLEVMNGHKTPYTKGIRLGNYTLVRELIIDYLEYAFRGEMTAQEALDGAVRDGNELLEKFEQEHTKGKKTR